MNSCLKSPNQADKFKPNFGKSKSSSISKNQGGFSFNKLLQIFNTLNNFRIEF
jgi:hypothetical protein